MLKIAFRFWPAAFVLFLAALLSSCATGPVPLRGPVTVTGDLTRLEAEDTTAIQFSPFIVLANRGDTIRWNNDVGVTITLLFGAEVPVGVQRLAIPIGETGEVVVDSLADEGRYKYGATLTAGATVINVDPYIDVPPPPKR